MEENYTSERRNDSVDVVALWRAICRKWYLFVGSVVICVGLVVCYLKIAKPQYEVLADILVNEDEKKGSSGGLSSLVSEVSGGGFSLDGMIGGGSVNDEILVISSHTIIREMVQRLELNKVYTSKKNFFSKKEYYGNSPITVDVPESMLDTLVAGFVVKVQTDKSSNKIKVLLKRGFFKTLAETEATSFPIKVDYGEGIVIDKTPYYKPDEKLRFVAHINGYDAQAERLAKRLEIDLSDKKANGISLKIEDSNRRRGQDMLDTLIECYNEDAVLNKNLKAENMLAFIDDRLVTVENELHEAERVIEQYKRENDLSDINSEAKIILEANNQYRKLLLEAETQYSIISMVDSFLNRPENKYSLVPVTTGLPDKGAAEAINEYNKLKREKLTDFVGDADFVKQFSKIKRSNKELLRHEIFKRTNVAVTANSMFVVQAKRIHEYKRQLMAILQVIGEYLAIVRDNVRPIAPKTYIFAGKAAPSYTFAKLIIKLINNVAQVVNNDPKVGNALKVVFIPDYKVSLAEILIPAADLSLQISTAGFEASGTGNMKFALNGALTLGTYDGANIEIREAVGEDNFFLFGLRVEDIKKMRPTYNPRKLYEDSEYIKRILNTLNSNLFCEKDAPSLFKPIFDELLNRDYFFVLADLEAYNEAMKEAERAYLKKEEWAKKAIYNVARIGYFSSDRAVKEYAEKIWHINSIDADSYAESEDEAKSA